MFVFDNDYERLAAILKHVQTFTAHYLLANGRSQGASVGVVIARAPPYGDVLFTALGAHSVLLEHAD